MRNLQLSWSEYRPYAIENVNQYVPARAGVYKISLLQQDGRVAVRYVGQSDNLNRRLKQHLDLKNEPNVKLAASLGQYSARFSFAEVPLQSDRNGAEKALYGNYAPRFNDPNAIPNDPNIVINFI